MKILSFLKKEFIQAIRAPESILLMIVFPLALTWLMGNAFGIVGTQTLELPELSFPVVAEESPGLEAMQSVASELRITLDRVSEEEALESVRTRASLGYIELREGDTIFHRLDADTRRGSDINPYLSEAMLFLFSKVYVQQAEVFQEAAVSGRFDLLENPPSPQVTLTEIPKRNQPGSFDRYGVTMLTLILMYGSLQAGSMLSSEYMNHTLERIKRSPFPPSALFFCKSFGAFIITVIQGAIVMLFNHFVLGVNYGNGLQTIAFLLPHIIFSVSLGIFVFMAAKKEATAVVLLNILIPVILVFGGAYAPMPETGFLSILSRFSPAYWLNHGLFDMIYANSFTRIFTATGINAALAAILLIGSYLLFMREKGERYGSYH